MPIPIVLTTNVYGGCNVSSCPTELKSSTDGYVSEVSRVDDPTVFRGPFLSIAEAIAAARAWDAEVTPKASEGEIPEGNDSVTKPSDAEKTDTAEVAAGGDDKPPELPAR